MKNDDLNFVDLPINEIDETVDSSDFVLVDNENREHEQKFQTKPTTFLKDSIKRFSKNKSSVVAAGILGTLLLLSFAVPIIDRNDVQDVSPDRIYLEPKLFPAGTGFWDGTKKWTKIAVDTNGHSDATTDEEKQEFWWPSPEDFKKSAVSNKTFTDAVYTSDRNKYASGGYFQFGISQSEIEEYAEFKTYTLSSFNLNSGDVFLKSLDIYDSEKLLATEGDKAYWPENYSNDAEVSLYFNYDLDSIEPKSIKILDCGKKYNVDSPINLTNVIKADSDVITNSISTFNKCNFSLKMKNLKNGKNECVLIKKFEFETSNTTANLLIEANFTDANELMLRDYDSGNNTKYWTVTSGIKKLHMAKVFYCDFVYDTYEAVFGLMELGPDKLSISKIEQFASEDLCSFTYDMDVDPITGELVITSYDFVVKSEKCPVKEITNLTITSNGDLQVSGVVEYFRYCDDRYDSMPIYIMGTDKNGKDMFKYVFEGLRTSLLLGICSFIVCFVIGLIWGSISGYFGGVVDLVMERITDILSGVPWIVVMTLVIKHLGQTFFVFGLSLCLTGWIGTAATTRTQFYRFRGREYVLASRSLGASDARLISKHILPNAMGTIITSSVLMIPSVIFSEATISYLGLGLKGLSSLGVILSDNQSQLTTHSYLLIFPAIIIALLMISFNLFGNGLRDAVNPSLKGEEQ